MYEYKIVSLETFMEIPEIKAIKNKEKFKAGDSDLSRSNCVVNFMQMMFDYMGYQGWEFSGITHTNSTRVDIFATGKGSAFFKGVADGLLSQAMGGHAKGMLTNEGLIETYIFKRLTNNKIAFESESKARSENQPIAKQEEQKPTVKLEEPVLIVTDGPLEEVALLELNKTVNPLLEKLKAVGYEISDSKITRLTTYWKLTYPSNGSFCEFNSVKELQDFAKNF